MCVCVCVLILSNWLKVANFWNAAHRRGVIRVSFFFFFFLLFLCSCFCFFLCCCCCGYWRSFMVFDYRICRNREANGRCRNINMTTLYNTFRYDSVYNWRFFVFFFWNRLQQREDVFEIYFQNFHFNSCVIVMYLWIIVPILYALQWIVITRAKFIFPTLMYKINATQGNVCNKWPIMCVCVFFFL